MEQKQQDFTKFDPTKRNGFLEKIAENTIFRDRRVLNIEWIPTKDMVINLDKKIEDMCYFISPVIRDECPPNCIIYGPSGTGKTLLCNIVKNEIENYATEPKFQIIYVKCSEYPTEFSFLTKISGKIGIRYRGTSKSNHYELLRQFLVNNILVIIMDEIDKMKNGNDVVFNLTRCENICIVGISNDLRFTDTYEPRTKSSLCERNIIFKYYNANELKEILEKRASIAFNPGVCESGVVAKCAALAAQEHGDARKAISLLKAAGEVAEKNGDKKIIVRHVDIGDETLDLDAILASMEDSPKQLQSVLAAIMINTEKGKTHMQTGDVFCVYEMICNQCGIKVLTQRRITDLIVELDVSGIINSRVISKGRYGRTREISLAIGTTVIKKLKDMLMEKDVWISY